MADPTSPDLWTARLANLLRGGMPAPQRAEVLRDLAASLITGQPDVDQTRHSILQMLRQRDEPSVPPRPAMANDDPVQPDWPTEPGQPLPPILPHGRAGVSLVAVVADAANLGAALQNWLLVAADEVVLVSAAPLGAALRAAGLADPRLRLVHCEAASVTQALNIGLRLVRHARVLIVAQGVRLLPDVVASPLPPGGFLVDAGPADGSAFVVDAHLADLAAVGGFNEYPDTADGTVEDLASRLLQVAQRGAVRPGSLTRLPPRAHVAQPGATLRAALLADPGFAALQNQFIAALMPGWRAEAALPCVLAGQDDDGLHLRATPAAPVPPHLRTEAIQHALIHLTRQKIGGQPERLSPRRIEMVLARPATDVFAVDIAVAAGSMPDLVSTRKGWAVVDIAPGAMQAAAFARVEALVAAQGQTLVLRGATEGVTGHPVIGADVDASGFWPMELRELARPIAPPRHATFPFNRHLVQDLQQLDLAGPSLLIRHPKLFVDAQHGLGNRLRAIASAGAIARGTGRELVIIWQPDDHCQCRFDDLFLPGGAVIDQGFVTEAASMGMDVYNYMEVEPDSAKDAPVDLSAFGDVYLRSAYPFRNPCSNWHSENAWLARLQPGEVVQDLVARVRSPNDLAVHIRMEGGAAFEHLPYEAAANWTPQAHRDIETWRKRSHFSRFFPRLDVLIADGLADTVFLAADTPAAYDAFAARYGDRVAGLHRPASDRSAQAIVFALADAILLGRAPRLLGSHWSSFSELAARLSPAPMIVELSGRDF